MTPFYSNIDKVPDYLGNTTERVTTEDFYWTNRMIAALADPHYTYTSNFIEQYQNKVQSTARKILNKYDKEFLEQKYTGKKASELCEQANEKMARMLKVETEDLLDKVLFEASCHMKNSFSRSDATQIGRASCRERV